MTESQRLSLRLSELRASINVLQGVESLTDEQRAELDKATAEYQDVESRWRAATITESDDEARAAGLFGDDGEAAEARGLLRAVSDGIPLTSSWMTRTSR